ncbi:MAG: MarR family transcriptional regulator [Burkholderiaceae bacterium]|nr:MarR family transcriptional regulator [Burkholderiaceae bacterium]
MSTKSDQASFEHRRYVARLVHQAQSAMVASLDKALAPFDLSAAQYAILSTLASGRADTAAQICKEISYSPGAMTRMLNRLEDKGLIVRTEFPDNRRMTKLELSEKGRSAFPAMLASSGRVIDGYFGAFEPAELRQLEVLLNKMMRRA